MKKNFSEKQRKNTNAVTLFYVPV